MRPFPPAAQVNKHRADIISEIENVARAMAESGACHKWLQHADPLVQQV